MDLPGGAFREGDTTGQRCCVRRGSAASQAAQGTRCCLMRTGPPSTSLLPAGWAVEGEDLHPCTCSLEPVLVSSRIPSQSKVFTCIK